VRPYLAIALGRPSRDQSPFIQHGDRRAAPFQLLCEAMKHDEPPRVRSGKKTAHPIAVSGSRKLRLVEQPSSGLMTLAKARARAVPAEARERPARSASKSISRARDAIGFSVCPP